MQLKRFTGLNGKLSVWNKRAGKLLQQAPNNTFGETHLYTIENERGEKDTSFEKALSKVEATAANLIDAIEGAVEQGRAPTFSASEKASLDLFFYTAWKRVPDFFGKAESINAGPEFLDEIFGALLIKHPDREAEIDALNTPQSRKRLLQAGKVQGMAIPSERILNILARRGLTILQLPPGGYGFLIGSLPIARTRHPLTDPEAEAWMPISPRLVIGLGMAEDTVTLGEFDPIRLTGFNRTIAAQSTMFGGPNPAQVKEMAEWLAIENVKFDR
uniref:DUF4238 domain-containing protein n=2 Tax=Paracoccus marcusii TaxID=59779 RepID=J7K538_9RHOB|nr:hypothetical protein [Paracoccus marcusii]